MRILEGSEILIMFSTGEYSLLHSRLKGVSISKQEQKITIELFIDLLYSKYEQQISLRFVDVSDYSLNEDIWTNFPSIEKYKFYKNHNGYYISLNPEVTFAGSVATDREYIRSKNVKATLMK
jgi:hypothetical protein